MRPVTSGENITQALRDSILSLRLFPGQELKTDELAALYGVSRSPVRDALMRLSKDGLVDIFPQRGTRVSLIDLERVRQERFFRKALEDHAISAFLEAPHSEALAQMSALLTAQQEQLEKADHLHFLKLDDDFHQLLFTAIHMDFCFDLIRERCVHYRRIRLLTFREPAVLGSIVLEHKALLDALGRGDATAAKEIDRLHLSRLLKEQEQLVRLFPGYFKA